MRPFDKEGGFFFVLSAVTTMNCSFGRDKKSLNASSFKPGLDKLVSGLGASGRGGLLNRVR